MKHAVEPAVPGGLSIFEKSCGYCGARFRVLAAQQADANRPEEYACPECGKEYALQAVDEPEVRLLRPRSDGKSDRYQETMF
jgi:DNA-directed RNA polymerase subunit RPC12/RpoP